jgi:SAM-dependent MidA family methyltransferase
MTALKRRIVDLIDALGPIPVSEYMALCLSDPRDGYYMTRDPFGRDGDFTTAPEISQMFGELIGAWVAATWGSVGRPAQPVIAEIGPGRGTLIKDMVRTLAQIAPALRETARFFLVETSPKLRFVQGATLEGLGGRFDWVNGIDELPQAPLLIVGNELFDAIPIRQYVKAREGWRERMVDIDADDNLVFTVGAGSLDPALLPQDARGAADGAIVEIGPARTALMQMIAERIARDGGAGVFFDYGYKTPALGDTLQALLKHQYDDPLAHPGQADLTAHVDFAALAGTARSAGLDANLTAQGDFLLGLGLLERAGRLGAKGDDALRELIASQVERLAGPDAMGTLFKVLVMGPSGTSLPGFPAAD